MCLVEHPEYEASVDGSHLDVFGDDGDEGQCSSCSSHSQRCTRPYFIQEELALSENGGMVSGGMTRERSRGDR